MHYKWDRSDSHVRNVECYQSPVLCTGPSIVWCFECIPIQLFQSKYRRHMPFIMQYFQRYLAHLLVYRTFYLKKLLVDNLITGLRIV